MENRPDAAAGSVAPTGCSKRDVKQETRDGGKASIKREDFTTEQVSLYSSRSLFRMSRISTARRSFILRHVGRVI
jgi:hypothetical protein